MGEPRRNGGLEDCETDVGPDAYTAASDWDYGSRNDVAVLAPGNAGSGLAETRLDYDSVLLVWQNGPLVVQVPGIGHSCTCYRDGRQRRWAPIT